MLNQYQYQRLTEMDPRIEEILMARAIKDGASVPTAQDATLAGSIPGAIAGAALGRGHRLAGGLVGAILGGGLGMGTRQMMIDNSSAASLLARAQSQGGLSSSDQELLGSILEDTYRQMGIR